MQIWPSDLYKNAKAKYLRELINDQPNQHVLKTCAEIMLRLGPNMENPKKEIKNMLGKLRLEYGNERMSEAERQAFNEWIDNEERLVDELPDPEADQ